MRSQHTERMFGPIAMTAERWAMHDAMQAADEGLTPRAYRCLLQLADGVDPSANDVEWLTDGVEPRPIARMVDGRCELSALGRLLVSAVERGDVEAMFKLTTMPELSR